jgi:hypothetical protein
MSEFYIKEKREGKVRVILFVKKKKKLIKDEFFKVVFYKDKMVMICGVVYPQFNFFKNGGRIFVISINFSVTTFADESIHCIGYNKKTK